MASALDCSAACKDIRNPIKLSNGCSTERFLMRQRYLRSYPLITNNKENVGINVALMKTKKWLKKKQRKYFRVDDDHQGNYHKQTGRKSRRDKKSKPYPCSSYVAAWSKFLLVCVAKVDART
ncbi:hypothetical protein REPUB_Repub09cG0176700 [Reevesia pubescens]